MISTFAAQQSALVNILSAETRETNAQTQVSTGKVATDLKGYAGNADTLTAMNSLNSRITTYLSNDSALSSTLQVQDSALTQASSAAQTANQAVTEALATGSAAGLMQALQGAMSQAVDALNTQYEGVYLFSGGQINTEPVTATSISQLTGPPSTSAFFQNDQLATASRLDNSTVSTTGFLASNLGQPLLDALKAVQAIDSGPDGPLTGSLTPAQTTALQAALPGFSSAFDNLNQAVAENGVNQNQVTATQTALTDRQTALTQVIGNITNVDEASAASELQLAQTALQASAQAFATMNASSLLSLLSPSSTG